ncbi:TBC1 domain family member 31 [Sitodiplosis mosellana]|uniref:TBC1 domain family member 31 n=1 Tax=Sitodiplosis mosellana TaxID=263140 RepID=UPI0024439704|nr:TBC1 domain family member 31 [Sitodiplosis mosellana]
MENDKNFDRIEKLPFKIKHNESEEHGLLLSVHHTELDDGRDKRVPFKLAGFSKNSDILIAISSRKDLFVFDLTDEKYWCFDEVCQNLSCFCFHPRNYACILVGTKYGSLLVVELKATSKIHQRIKAFDNSILEIIGIHDSVEYFICYTSTEALICSHSTDATLRIEHRFFKAIAIKSILTKLVIKKIVTHVTADMKLTVAVLLNDESLYIYGVGLDKIDSINLIKHIHPIDRLDVYFKHSDLNNNKIMDKKNAAMDIIFLDMKFHENGNELWLMSKNSYIIVIDAQQWHVIKAVSPEKYHVKMSSFVSCALAQEVIHKSLSSSFHSLCIGLTSTKKLVFLSESNTNDSIDFKPFLPWKCAAVKRFSLSPNSKLLALISVDGSFKLYSIEFMLLQIFQTVQPKITAINHENMQLNQSLNALDKKVAKLLSRQRLLTILSEYGEYPAQYRQIIWKYLLKLPNNTEAYCDLLERGLHPCTRSYGQSFRVFDPVLQKKLKCIASYLCNWSKILGVSFDLEDHFLPYFIFPFLKLYSNNLMVCFELVATILLNQCSLWFEFSPLLPMNYLGLIENLIDHFEPKLMQFYRRSSVTSVTFAWKMMRTAFSDVLVEYQWCQLWDHILSAPAYFLVFIVVAFNCIQRSAIERLANAKEIHAYFDEPCAINIHYWLRTAYEQMSNCPIDLHPNQYIQPFACLGVEKQYCKILNYPRIEFNKRMEQKKQLHNQMQVINRKYIELEKYEMELMQQIVNDVQCQEHQQRMQKVQLTYELSLINQLKRIENQRQHLILSERQLNDRESMMKKMMKQNDAQNEVDTREIYLKRALCDMVKSKLRDETELLRAESVFRKQEIDLLIKECNLSTNK